MATVGSKRRTDLKIWPSKAKNLEELKFDVRKSLAPPKSIKKDEKLSSGIVKNSDFVLSFFAGRPQHYCTVEERKEVREHGAK